MLSSLIFLYSDSKTINFLMQNPVYFPKEIQWAIWDKGPIKIHERIILKVVENSLNILLSHLFKLMGLAIKSSFSYENKFYTVRW